jgi:hypothetical protein
LYGGVQDEYKHIVFFSKTAEYIETLWRQFLVDKVVYTPIFKRKIVFSDDLNKNKLFNYILQSVETERNIIILDKLSKIKTNGSLPILYTYDSILFDVHPTDSTYISQVKSIMEKDGFPVGIEVGDNYKEMVITHI